MLTELLPSSCQPTKMPLHASFVDKSNGIHNALCVILTKLLFTGFFDLLCGDFSFLFRYFRDGFTFHGYGVK